MKYSQLFMCVLFGVLISQSCKKSSQPASPKSYTKKMDGVRNYIGTYRELYLPSYPDTITIDTTYPVSQTIYITVYNDSTLIDAGKPSKLFLYSGYDATSNSINFHKADITDYYLKYYIDKNIIEYIEIFENNRDTVYKDLFSK